LKFFCGPLAIAGVLIHLRQAEVRIRELCIRSHRSFVGGLRPRPIATLRLQGS